MKIGAISDLHIKDEESQQFIETLTDVCLSKRLDLLLIAGDISEDVNLTIKYIEQINTRIKCLYVPGNHDLWNRYNQLAIGEIYQMFENDENCLLGKIYNLSDEYDLVGHIGWYDYSLGDIANFNQTELDRMSIEDRTWNDKHYNSWTDNNKLVCNQIDDQIERLLKMSRRKKILITHMISNPGFKVMFDEVRNHKGFFNSYLGSERLYQMTKNNNITHAICGHVHYRKTIVDNQVIYVCPCLGSAGEWGRYAPNTTTKYQLEQCLYSFEIQNANKSI